jgi:hypothetical protein
MDRFFSRFFSIIVLIFVVGCDEGGTRLSSNPIGPIDPSVPANSVVSWELRECRPLCGSSTAEFESNQILTGGINETYTVRGEHGVDYMVKIRIVLPSVDGRIVIASTENRVKPQYGNTYRELSNISDGSGHQGRAISFYENFPLRNEPGMYSYTITVRESGGGYEAMQVFETRINFEVPNRF